MVPPRLHLRLLPGAVILHPDMLSKLPSTAVPIVSTEPYVAWERVAAPRRIGGN
jgi:hypothetical protein